MGQISVKTYTAPGSTLSDNQHARILSMLDVVSSDTDYETWRNINWALASTGWVCARDIAHKWSQRAPERYDRDVLDKLFDDFDPARGVTIGTLIHHARLNGWNGSTYTAASNVLPPLELPRLMTAEQLRQIPTPPYLVRGILPAHGLAALYGEPGSAKSFLAADLAHAIALGTREWFGFPVRQAPVVYIALEGQGGMGRRIAALEKHTGQPCPDSLRFYCNDIQLLTGDGIDSLVADIVKTVGSGTVVMIDTLNQASPGADENTSQDMGRIIGNAKRLAAAVGGLVLLIHHAGKDRSRGLRGHSSLLGAMDVVIETVNDNGARSWSIRKAKDDSGDVVRDFDLIPYEVDHDEFGPITSCAIRPAIHTKIARRKPPTGKHQKAALDFLRAHLTGGTECIGYDEALVEVAASLDVVKGKARERAKEGIDALIRSGHISLGKGGISLG